MAKRKITVRLHRQHDMDLINVYLSYPMKFTTRMKEALDACIHNRPYSIEIVEAPLKYQGFIKGSLCVHITLDEDEDIDILDALEQVKDRQRNSFIKAATRRCLNSIPLSSFFVGDGLVISQSDAIRKSGREAASKVYRAPADMIKKEPVPEDAKEAIGTRSLFETVLDNSPADEGSDDAFDLLDALAHS